MSRCVALVLMAMTFLVGCSGGSPVIPQLEAAKQGILHEQAKDYETAYHLWSEGSMYINAAHDRIDVVPKRAARLHLNALKFLEDYCSNCLQVVRLKNNGDSTVDLTVKITHPFPGYPEFTGFDVKGILMFNGSWENPGYPYFPPFPEPFRVS